MVATMSGAWENTVGGRRSSKNEKDDDWENERDGTIANEHCRMHVEELFCFFLMDQPGGGENKGEQRREFNTKTLQRHEAVQKVSNKWSN